MADQRLPALDSIDALADGDLFYCVDVSITTDHASGSSRKVTWADLRAAVISQVPTSLPSQTQNRVLASPNGSTGTPGFRFLVGADIPQTGLTIRGYTAPVQTASDGATITLNAANDGTYKVTLGGNRTLAITNAANGSRIALFVKQDATGGRTLSWPAGITITWMTAGGGAPTVPSTANATGSYLLVFDSATTAFGFVTGTTV